MAQTNTETRDLIRRLREQMERAIDVFSAARGTEPSDHPCAMNGAVNDLLAHNAEHDRMHAGQVADRRYGLGILQRDPRHRYLAEWYRERAALIALLLDLPDSALDASTEDGDTTIREIVEHVLYWDKDSVEATAAQLVQPAA